MFFDTNTVIAILKQIEKDDLSEFFNFYFLNNKQTFISYIVLVEMLSWKDLDLKTTFELEKEIKNKFIVVEQGYDILLKTAEIRRVNPKLKLPDAIIAATAFVFHMPLITFNIKDFQKVAGLSLIDANKIRDSR